MHTKNHAYLMPLDFNTVMLFL